jgi:hypothetical protein
MEEIVSKMREETPTFSTLLQALKVSVWFFVLYLYFLYSRMW